MGEKLSNYALLMDLLNASKVTQAVHPQVATYKYCGFVLKLVSFELNDISEKGQISKTSIQRKQSAAKELLLQHSQHD